jgi:hypothetical protein
MRKVDALRCANTSYDYRDILWWKSPRLLDVGDAEPHLAFILLWLILSQFAEGTTTPQLPLLPTGLTTLVCHQTTLTNLLWLQ